MLTGSAGGPVSREAISVAEVSLHSPVQRVSWNSIQDYLVATPMRLPTEAEWEWVNDW